MTMGLTEFEGYLKTRYIEPRKLQDAMYKYAPLLGMMPKDGGAGGEFMQVPAISVRNRKRSADYATALASAADTETVRFQVGYVDNFQFARWSDNVMRDSKRKGSNAVASAVEVEVDGAMANLFRDHGQGVFGNVGGAKGTVAVGGLSTTSLTLANPEDSIHFEPGDQIVASANDGTSSGHSLLDSGDYVTILAVDHSTGILTGDATWTTQITGLLAGHYLFHKGDFKLKASGLLGWIPPTAPGATLFHNVDRSVNVVRLGGHRFLGGGLAPQEVVSRFAARMARINGAKPDVYCVNDEVWSDYETALGNMERIQIPARGVDGKKVGNIGYDAIKCGDIAIIKDPNCPVRYGFMLTMDTWLAGSSGDGELVEPIEVAGSMIQRTQGSDAWHVEFKSRWNIACKAPWENGVVDLETAFAG